jgi:FAD/FMN-containing dehydrogenase
MEACDTLLMVGTSFPYIEFLPKPGQALNIASRFCRAAPGTSLAGQCCNAAIVIDMSRHVRGILSVDAARTTARVQPGLVLDELQHAVKPRGLMCGPDPATHAWCTFGGMIGNNSCGVPASARRV